jgi:uncharacterized flavoprotein (TIGR03862 family)
MSNLPDVVVIGGGPAGLMAAEVLSNAGFGVDVYESMPTLGRKFLRAGLGGLNITHSEAFSNFCSRYGKKREEMEVFLKEFPPSALRAWVHDLGIETFIGTSGRVFPKEMKAAPLLRTWVHRLRKGGVRFHLNHKWIGFGPNNAFRIQGPIDEISVKAPVTILALGGASWPELGSTGEWTPWLQDCGVKTDPWLSANCGFDVNWSELLKEKFDGAPLKSVSLKFTDLNGTTETRQGELLIKSYGVEGSLIYAFSQRLRDYIGVHGQATFTLDLLPGRDAQRVLKDVSRPRGSRSLSRHLQSCLGDDSLKRTLLYEILNRKQLEHPATLAKFLKALPITLRSPRPLAEAISTAGGVRFSSVNESLMLNELPGVFVAGEMLDWEAPTGGYLLTGCLATGAWAGHGAVNWLKSHNS